MAVPETPNRANSRRLQACVLLCAMGVLPIGVTFAQDYEGAGKRLAAAIEAGELTPEQARAKFQAYRKEADAKKDQGPDRAREYLMKVKKELGAAVEAGKISKEDAAKKYQGAERAIRERMAAGRNQTQAKKDQGPGRAREYLMKVKKELGAAIEAGKISKEDAAKKYQGAERAIKERMAAGRGERGSNRITREDYGRADPVLRKLVAEGKISGEDARAKLAAMRRMIGEQSKGDAKKITPEDLSRAGIAIRKAVAEGKLSSEDARAKIAAIRRMIAEQSQRGGGARPDWEGIKKRIEGAVQRGDMTREQADAKYKEIRERMAGRRQR